MECIFVYLSFLFFFFSSRRRHTRYWRDWSSDVCSSDLISINDRPFAGLALQPHTGAGWPIIFLLMGGTVRGIPIWALPLAGMVVVTRSEERRVGKECRSRWSPYH